MNHEYPLHSKKAICEVPTHFAYRECGASCLIRRCHVRDSYEFATQVDDSAALASLRASGLTQRLWSYDLYRYKDRTQAAARLPQADNSFFVSNPTICDMQGSCFADGSYFQGELSSTLLFSASQSEIPTFSPIK